MFLLFFYISKSHYSGIRLDLRLSKEPRGCHIYVCVCVAVTLWLIARESVRSGRVHVYRFHCLKVEGDP